MAEVAGHCTYCHNAIVVRSIQKYYSDIHPQLIGYERQAKEQVIELANLGSGRGTCVFFQAQRRDVRSHKCGILFQFNVMFGQIYDPVYFPCIPTQVTVTSHEQ